MWCYSHDHHVLKQKTLFIMHRHYTEIVHSICQTQLFFLNVVMFLQSFMMKNKLQLGLNYAMIIVINTEDAQYGTHYSESMKPKSFQNLGTLAKTPFANCLCQLSPTDVMSSY
jgi:hypothetical protein